MEQKTVWQQGSGNPENPNYLAAICEWWENLNGKEITWRQRIIPQSGEVEELDWEPQRFDEVFAIANPAIRGITFLEQLQQHCKALTWLNPMPRDSWQDTTAEAIAYTKIVQMFPADRSGFENAIKVLQ